jgi:hypothetical protein
MPRTFSDLPPEHPIFSGGVGFVFRSEEPLDIAPAEDDTSSSDEDE